MPPCYWGQLSRKALAAFALGVSMRMAKISVLRHMLLVVAFSLSTPVGVSAIGIGLTSAIDQSTLAWVSGVFLGISAGTFLYIALVEVMQPEFSNHQDLGFKYCFIIAGFAIMAVVAVWA